MSEILLSSAIGLTALQTLVLVVMGRRLKQLRDVRTRMSRLTDAVALLTDTSESGLTTLIREVERLAQRQALPRAESRDTVARRVLDASRRGESNARIAMEEAMSETEVRLHLAMARATGLANKYREVEAHVG